MCLIMTTEGWQQLGNGKVCTNHNNVEGVYRPSPLDEVLPMLDARADRFIEANNVQNMMLKQEFFGGHSFLDKGYPPLVGAFGEKL